MSQWLTNTLAKADRVADSYSAPRKAALARLKTAPWPSRKVESWRYTSVAALDTRRFAVPDEPLTVSAEQLAQVLAQTNVPDLKSIDLIFINGCLQTDLATLNLPVGLSVRELSDAASGPQSAVDLFATIKPQGHVFGLVNDVLARDGLVLDIAAGVTLTQPVRLVQYFDADVESHTRVLVQLGEGAKATIIEQFSGAEAAFNTAFAEYALQAGSVLEHYRLGLQMGHSLNIGGAHFRLATKARLNSFLIGYGSELSRLDVDVIHAGEHAQATLNAVYLLDGQEQYDLHTNIEHAVANGTTLENVRGIVADKSRAVFNGRIHIHRNAQKTLAELNNRNLLLSRQAEINTKPELEIYADDVRCAHGATVAEIDRKALYYLQSRGIEKAQAQVMLNFGFINELLDDMPRPVLADWLRTQLRRRFAQMTMESP